jgi:hypothetical protein
MTFQSASWSGNRKTTRSAATKRAVVHTSCGKEGVRDCQKPARISAPAPCTKTFLAAVGVCKGELIADPEGIVQGSEQRTDIGRPLYVVHRPPCLRNHSRDAVLPRGPEAAAACPAVSMQRLRYGSLARSAAGPSARQKTSSALKATQCRSGCSSAQAPRSSRYVAVGKNVTKPTR